MLGFKKMRMIKILMVIIMFFAVYAITYTLNSQYIENNTNLIYVTVAAKKISAYSPIGREDVLVVKKPRSVVAEDAVLDPDKFFVEKEYYVKDLGFGPGDIIRSQRLSEQEYFNLKNIAGLAGENKMLVSINTNLVQSCSNLVIPGVLVNAVVYIKSKVMGDPDEVISPVEDSRLGKLMVVDKKNAESAVPLDEGREALPEVVTIMLNQEDIEVAKALVAYNEQGNIYLLPIGFNGDTYLAARNTIEIKEKDSY